MGKSSSLRVEDVRAILQLIGECRELGDDHIAWRTHFVVSACKIIRAECCEFGETIVGNAGQPQPLWGDFWGLKEEKQRQVYAAAVQRFLTEGLNWSPMMPPYSQELVRDNGICLTRNDLVPDKDWDSSSFHQDAIRPLGMGPMLYCHRTVVEASPRMRFLTFFRASGDGNFSLRECALTRELHSAIGQLIGGALAGNLEPSPTELSPRSRRVLRCLLEGESDKQIAKQLGLSQNTVNHYVKGIFEHFRVQSRPELLARWLRRAGHRWPWAEDD
jgi:DNA-binding CsgD family transcriptional regulator